MQGQSEIEINLIIVINDELAVNSLSNIQVLAKNFKGQLDADYVPGKLWIRSSVEQELSSVNDSVFITFDNNIFCNHKHYLMNYKLPISMQWVDQDFVVLRVYDLARGKYKRVFKPLSAKMNYTFELDFPGGGTFRRVRIGKLKKQTDDCE
jgi:hypothetical protein